jgi:hypothetical protein
MARRGRAYLPYALLFGVALVLVALYWLSLKARHDILLEAMFIRMFDLNGEANFPAWFSSALWLIAAHHCYRIHMACRDRAPLKRQAPSWLALAVGSVVLSLDETATIHESIGAIIDTMRGNPSGIEPVYSWVELAAPLVALAGLSFVPFLLRLPAATALGLIAAGAIYLGGAMGMETLGSLKESKVLSAFPFGLTWGRDIAIEEFLEMAGTIAFAAVLRFELRRLASGLAPKSTLAIAMPEKAAA